MKFIKFALICALFFSTQTFAAQSKDGIEGFKAYQKKDYKTALKKWKLGCTKGDVNSCVSIGSLYHTGLGVDKNESKAMEIYERGCKAKSGRACHNLAAIYQSRDDNISAQKFYELGCEAKLPFSCHNLAILEQKKPTPDNAKTIEYFKKACDYDGASSCHLLALAYINGAPGLQNDEKKGAILLKKACDLGFIPACNDYGETLRFGTGVKKDPQSAAQLFKKACDAKFAPACGNLAFMYFYGENGAKDERKAVELLRKSCKFGSEKACEIIERVDENGTKTDKNSQSNESNQTAVLGTKDQNQTTQK